MTLREAAQQALEALEKVTKHFTRTPSTLMDSEARVEAHKAITALRERLAQPEQEPVCWTVADGWVYPDDTERVDEIVKAEQEPVAWADAIIDDLQGLFDTDGITEQDSGDALIRLSDAIAAVEDEKKRYTAPAKREWVGLTQQDIDIAFDDTQEGGGFYEFALAIEAILKGKNT